MIYNDDPDRLVEEFLNVDRTEHFRHPSVFCSEVNEFRGEAKQTDDVTLLLMDLVLKQSDTACSVDPHVENRSKNGHGVPAANQPAVADRNAVSAE